jgi:hypothetical protein
MTKYEQGLLSQPLFVSRRVASVSLILLPALTAFLSVRRGLARKLPKFFSHHVFRVLIIFAAFYSTDW